MGDLAIFIYGLAVTSIVALACWLIVYGIIEERRSREQLDAGPDASDPYAGERRGDRPTGSPGPGGG